MLIEDFALKFFIFIKDRRVKQVLFGVDTTGMGRT
jgi:hypothetical protein